MATPSSSRPSRNTSKPPPPALAAAARSARRAARLSRGKSSEFVGSGAVRRSALLAPPLPPGLMIRHPSFFNPCNRTTNVNSIHRKKLGVNAVLKTLLRRFYAPQMEALAEREAAKVYYRIDGGIGHEYGHLNWERIRRALTTALLSQQQHLLNRPPAAQHRGRTGWWRSWTATPPTPSSTSAYHPNGSWTCVCALNTVGGLIHASINQ